MEYIYRNQMVFGAYSTYRPDSLSVPILFLYKVKHIGWKLAEKTQS